MLARKFRLPPSIFFYNTQPLHTKFFAIKYKKNDLSFSRFSFVVSKKIDKKAVVRNKLRRTTRLCIEGKWLSLKGYDMLFVLCAAALPLTKTQMQHQVDVAIETIMQA